MPTSAAGKVPQDLDLLVLAAVAAGVGALEAQHR